MIANVVGQDCELIAANPEGRGRDRSHLLQSGGEFLEDLVADDMAHGVVDRLEVFDLDEEQGEGSGRLIQLAFDHGLEAASVLQVRQLIVMRQLPIALL
ncbi:MAG TPA: hypothetical protein VIN77_08910 [Aurantimonas sp.]